MSSKTPFEGRAKMILAHSDPREVRRGEVRRPFFIEITGTPSAGKTTAIGILDRFFRRQGFKVWKPTEGAEIVRNVSRKDFLYNIRTGLYALETLIDYLSSREFDLVIFDRAVYDAFCWMLYWQKKENITPEWKEVIQKFFLHPRWADSVDLCLFVICKTEEALRRELQWALTEKLGETTNPSSIDFLLEVWREAYASLKAKGAPVGLIDTTKLNPREVSERILEEALAAMENGLKLKVGTS